MASVVGLAVPRSLSMAKEIEMSARELVMLIAATLFCEALLCSGLVLLTMFIQIIVEDLRGGFADGMKPKYGKAAIVLILVLMAIVIGAFGLWNCWQV
jgi:hypothetical protein